jgi:deoxyribonuclease-2
MAEIEALAGQLLYNQPDVYSYSISTTTKNNYPYLKDLAAKNFPTTAKCSVATIGISTSFAKTGEWGKDLWDDCVAPHFQADILVESWLRGLEIGWFVNAT